MSRILIVCLGGTLSLALAGTAPAADRLPFPDGTYVSDARYCTMTDEQRYMAAGDAQLLNFRTIRDGQFGAGYETACSQSNIQLLGERLLFDETCSAEGESFTQTTALQIVGPDAFKDRDIVFTNCTSLAGPAYLDRPRPRLTRADLDAIVLSDAALDEAQRHYETTFSRGKLEELQWALARMGYFAGTFDGEVDAALMQSIGAFQAAMTGTPEILLTERQVRDIGTYQRHTSARFADGMTDAVIETIQVQLNLLGYNSGEPDGRMGPNTRGAIRAFQSSFGMAVTGEPSPALYERLFLTDSVRSGGEFLIWDGPENYNLVGDLPIAASNTDDLAASPETAILGPDAQEPPAVSFSQVFAQHLETYAPWLSRDIMALALAYRDHATIGDTSACARAAAIPEGGLTQGFALLDELGARYADSLDRFSGEPTRVRYRYRHPQGLGFGLYDSTAQGFAVSMPMTGRIMTLKLSDEARDGAICRQLGRFSGLRGIARDTTGFARDSVPFDQISVPIGSYEQMGLQAPPRYMIDVDPATAQTLLTEKRDRVEVEFEFDLVTARSPNTRSMLTPYIIEIYALRFYLPGADEPLKEVILRGDALPAPMVGDGSALSFIDDLPGLSGLVLREEALLLPPIDFSAYDISSRFNIQEMEALLDPVKRLGRHILALHEDGAYRSFETHERGLELLGPLARDYAMANGNRRPRLIGGDEFEIAENFDRYLAEGVPVLEGAAPRYPFEVVMPVRVGLGEYNIETGAFRINSFHSQSVHGDRDAGLFYDVGGRLMAGLNLADGLVLPRSEARQVVQELESLRARVAGPDIDSRFFYIVPRIRVLGLRDRADGQPKVFDTELLSVTAYADFGMTVPLPAMPVELLYRAISPPKTAHEAADTDPAPAESAPIAKPEAPPEADAAAAVTDPAEELKEESPDAPTEDPELEAEAAMIAAPPPAPPTAPALPAVEFDVVGLRLGQTLAAALEIAQAHLPEAKVLHSTDQQALETRLFTRATLVVSQDRTEQITLFHERVGPGENLVVALARGVIYDTSSLTARVVAKAAEEKYGPADAIEESGALTQLVWSPGGLRDDHDARDGAGKFAFSCALWTGGRLPVNWIDDSGAAAWPRTLFGQGPVPPGIAQTLSAYEDARTLEPERAGQPCGPYLSVGFDRGQSSVFIVLSDIPVATEILDRAARYSRSLEEAEIDIEF